MLAGIILFNLFNRQSLILKCYVVEFIGVVAEKGFRGRVDYKVA